MEQSGARQRISWELVGILLVLGVFAVGLVLWVLSPEAKGELRVPGDFTLDPTLSLESGVTEDGRPYLGRSDAAVTVYQFTDFQCPHCKAFTDESRPFRADYLATGKVRLVWVNFPTYGKESDAAAVAGVCALDQGRFWEFHDWMYANQSKVPESGGYSAARLLQVAEKVGLDRSNFEACEARPASAARVKRDADFGTESGVTKTPTFLVGDRQVVGNDMEDLRRLLDSAVSR